MTKGEHKVFNTCVLPLLLYGVMNTMVTTMVNCTVAVLTAPSQSHPTAFVTLTRLNNSHTHTRTHAHTHTHVCACTHTHTCTVLT